MAADADADAAKYVNPLGVALESREVAFAHLPDWAWRPHPHPHPLEVRFRVNRDLTVI